MRKTDNQLPSPDAGYAKMMVFFPWLLTRRIFEKIGEEYARKFSPWQMSKERLQAEQNHLFMMIRPSMLPDLMKMTNLNGGCFIYSMWQGYRDEPPKRKLEDFLQSRGTSTIYIHSSGHARVSDLQRTLDMLQPKKTIPIMVSFPGIISKCMAMCSFLRMGLSS